MSDRFLIDVKLLVEMGMLRPYEELAINGIRALIIHGEADSMVPCEITKAIVADLPSVNAVYIPGMEHGYTDADDDDGVSAASNNNLNSIISKALECINTYDSL